MTTTPTTLVLTHPIPAEPLVEAVRRIAPEIALQVHRPELDRDSTPTLASVEAVLGWRLPAGLAPRLPGLRWVQSVAAGVEKLLAPDLPPEVPVSRIVDPAQAEGIAQFATAMVLRHLCRFEACEALQRERRWQRAEVATPRAGRVVVLGTGAMGGATLAMLRAVGLDAHGWSRRAGVPLHDALAAAAVVVCALPLTADTADILDAAAFAAMPRGAYLVNIARGGHVVEPDLIDAVRSGRLSGAALDVQRREPLPADDPLWDAPGITITPHVAAESSQETIAAQFVEGWRALRRGETPPRTIDRALGY